MRVFVYYNLHRHCLSIRAVEGPARGRVVLHASAVELENVSFKVSAAGRARVLRERSKNVHAGVVGDLVCHLSIEEPEHLVQAWESRRQDLQGPDVTYDPYRFETFVQVPGHEPAPAAQRCVIVNNRIRVQSVQV